MSISGIQFNMEQRIVHKLKKVGATSLEKAVTIEEANMDTTEVSWVNYFAVDYLGKIRKNGNDRYYTEEIESY